MKPKEFRLTTSAMMVGALVVFAAILVAGANMTMEDPTLVVGFVYAMTFMALAWKFPPLALAITLGMSPFQTDISSGFGPFHVSAGEACLALSFIVYVVRSISTKKPIQYGPLIFPVLVYLAICTASSLVDWRPDTEVPALLQMALYFIVAVVVFANFVEKTEQLMLGLYTLVGVCIALAIIGLNAGTFYILGLHKNGVGASLACGIVICTELWLVNTKAKMRVALFISMIIITAGLVFSLSRGAWLGALAGFFVVVFFRGKFRFAFQSVLVLVPVVAVFWFMLPQDKKDYAVNFDPNSVNINARLVSIDQAKEMFYANPIYGVGVGLRKEFDATNVFWVTLAETGIPGLVAFGMIHLMTLMMIYKTQKYVPRNDPQFTLLVLGGALIFQKLVHGLVDHYWSRGSLLVAWGAVGMAVGVYYNVQRRLEKERVSRMAQRRLDLRTAARTGI